jgi:hypothetical protein
MKRLAVLALGWACLSAVPVFADELADAVRNIRNAEEQFRTGARPSSLNLDAEMRAITKAIDSGSLSPARSTFAYYYRARAGSLVNAARVRNGEGADKALAQATLKDYDRVISGDTSGNRVTNAMYSAGLVMRSQLADVSAAYRYWDKCSRLGHAGCMNIMAWAHVSGIAGVPISIPEAVELHRKVYRTGTKFICAGVFSASAIAQIIHFAGLKLADGDELEWFKRAGALHEQLAEPQKVADICHRAGFEIDEYLVRLSRGDDRPDLLHSAFARSTREYDKPLAEYLLGKISDQQLRETAARARDWSGSCNVFFTAWWKAQLSKNMARAGEYRDLMAKVEQNRCENQLALVRLRSGA